MTAAVVVDIDGTTSPTASVYDALYPYARSRSATWVAAHPDDAHAASLRSHGDVVATRTRWSDEDLKETALKAVQGRIWDEGFARGELAAPCYADAVDGLRRWHGRGMALSVFSSGSVTAQQAWFRHSSAGD